MSFIKPFKLSNIKKQFKEMHTICCNKAACNNDVILNTRKKELCSKLKKSIENNFQGFDVYYQPQISASTGECVSCEALIRWGYIENKFEPTNEVINCLEELDLLPMISNFVIGRSAFMCKSWIQKGLDPSFAISINLSASEITNITLCDEIFAIVKKFDLSPTNLNLEITESMFIHDLDKAITFLNCIREYGFGVSIDDFGTGYTALSYLYELPISEVKIDASFTQKIEKNEITRAIVKAVTEISHKGGVRVCAEGVETKEQMDILTAEGVDLLQGYYFNSPISSDIFEKLYVK